MILGLINLTAWNGNKTKKQEGWVNFPHGALGKLLTPSPYFQPFKSILFLSGFLCLGLELIQHAAPKSRGQEYMCFYYATRGSRFVCFGKLGDIRD